MPAPRRAIALALTAAVLLAGASLSTPPASAQAPGDPGRGKGQVKAPSVKKKVPKRRPRNNAAVGVIVPYPMPPVLIIRQTPEAHDEIRALLDLLRYY